MQIHPHYCLSDLDITSLFKSTLANGSISTGKSAIEFLWTGTLDHGGESGLRDLDQPDLLAGCESEHAWKPTWERTQPPKPTKFSLKNRGYSTEVIYSSPDQDYDFMGDKAWQTGHFYILLSKLNSEVIVEDKQNSVGEFNFVSVKYECVCVCVFKMS